MTSPDAETRSWRRAAGGTALAIVAGALALVLQRSAPVLVPPPACPGVLEALSVTVARVFSAAPLGAWFLRLWSPAQVLSIACVASAFHRSGARWLETTAVAVTVGTLPFFAPSLAPPASLGLVAAAAPFLIAPAPSRGTERRGALMMTVAYAAMALVVPPLMLPLALIAAWQAAAQSRRWITGVLALAAVLAASAALRLALPALPPVIGGSTPSCALPTLWRLPSARTLATISSPFFAGGPYIVVLAALGAFVWRDRARDVRLRPAMTFAVAPVFLALATSLSPEDTLRVLLPPLLLMWLLAAVGLMALVDTCRAGVGGRLGAALLVGLVPGLQLMRPLGLVAADRVPLGHDTVTSRSLRTLLDAMPDSTAIVTEDATTDLVLRSLAGTWQRSGKHLFVADRRASELPAFAADPRHTVIALPAAQAELQHLGFRLQDLDLTPWSGVTRVTTGGPCVPVTRQWAVVSDVAAGGAVALVADDDDAVGPLTMYAGGEKAFGPKTLYWPGATTRGFFWGLYDSTAASRARIKDQGTADHAPTAALLQTPDALYIEVWRTPDAPLTLAVDLGAPAAIALARLKVGAPAQHLRLCAAFPHLRRRIDGTGDGIP